MSRIKRYCYHFIAPREEDKVEVEVLMNMELWEIEEFPAEVEVSKPIELEKERSSQTLNEKKKLEGRYFQEKKSKSMKVNLYLE
jgi:hypothetical protein